MICKEFERLHGSQAHAGIFSQAEEQHVILNYFGDRVGRWLDVGACDGISCSNTYALALHGWGGVAVEPDPVALEALRHTHDGNPSVVIVGAAVANHDGTISFHTSDGGGVSTTSDNHRNKWSRAARFSTIEVPCITVSTLLRDHAGPFQMLSVDVEGCSVDVLKMFPLSAMGVELVVVEHDGRDKEVRDYCDRHGLSAMVYRSRENLVLAR